MLIMDKGMAKVVLDKQDYISKAEDLLGQSDTYRSLAADHSKKQKMRLINILTRIKTEGGLGDNTYKKMYPTGAGSLKDTVLHPYLPVRVQSLMGWPRN